MTTWKCDQPDCDKDLSEDDTKYFTDDGCWCEECWLKEDEKYMEILKQMNQEETI